MSRGAELLVEQRAKQPHDSRWIHQANVPESVFILPLIFPQWQTHVCHIFTPIGALFVLSLIRYISTLQCPIKTSPASSDDKKPSSVISLLVQSVEYPLLLGQPFSLLIRQVIQQIRQLRDKRSIGVKRCSRGWIRICRSPPHTHTFTSETDTLRGKLKIKV